MTQTMVNRLVRYIKYIHSIGWFRYLLLVRWKASIAIRSHYYRMICGAAGSDLRIARGLRLHDPQSLFVGHHVGMNDDVFIMAGGRVTIGNYTIIGPKTIILSADHNCRQIDVPIRFQGGSAKPVTLEDDVWLGAACIILPGVTIGRGSIIGAGAVVADDIPPYSIAAGVPARIIRSRLDRIVEDSETNSPARGRSGF